MPSAIKKKKPIYVTHSSQGLANGRHLEFCLYFFFLSLFFNQLSD